jgi:hypothetical protein
MLPRLDNSETQAIGCAIEEAQEHFSLHPQQVSSYAGLEDYLSRHCGDDSPDIIHFDGHGTFGRRCKKCPTVTTRRSVDRCTNCSQSLEGLKPQGYLVFENAQGRPDYRSADEFADLVRQALVSVNHEARGGTRLIVLSACRSGVARGAGLVFNGVAQRLIDAGVPAVVAMQFSIRADAAERFAGRLYQQIAAGAPLVTAMSWGRTALGDDAGDQWYRPVLYLRWRDNEGGQLFALPEQSPVDTSNALPVVTIKPLSVGSEDAAKLANLLTKSGCVQTGNARRALCIEIGIDANALEFIEGGAPRTFALQMVQYLYDTDNRTAALRLCNALRRDLHGSYLAELEMIRMIIIEGSQL